MPKTVGWYHAHNSVVRRADAKTAVGAVSYITGEPMHDEETGRYCTRKHPGDVLDFGMCAPDHGPARFADKAQLEKTWNDSQRSEKHPRAQLAHHWNIALSREWTPAQQSEVMKAIAQEAQKRYGVMSAWAVHAPTDHGDDRNAHGHLVYNLRKITADGFGKKVRELADMKTYIAERNTFREIIANQLNAHLEKWGSAERVTHLSFEARGIAQEPTIHLGAKLHQAELAGQTTRVGMHNRGVRHRNQRYEAEIRRHRPEQSDARHPVAIIRKMRRWRLRDEIADQRRKRRTTRMSGIDPASREEIEKRKEEQIEAYVAIEVREKKLEQKLQEATAESEAFAAETAAIKEQTRVAQAYRDQLMETAEHQKKPEASAAVGENTPRNLNADLADPRLRYAEAVTVYDPKRPWSTLAQAAAIEGSTFARQIGDFHKLEALTLDPRDRAIVAMGRRIVAAEYLAVTNERLGKLSSALNGPNSPEAVKYAKWATDNLKQAKELREQRSIAREQQELRETLKPSTTAAVEPKVYAPASSSAPAPAPYQTIAQSYAKAADITAPLVTAPDTLVKAEAEAPVAAKSVSPQERAVSEVLDAMGDDISRVVIMEEKGGWVMTRVFETDDGRGGHIKSEQPLRSARTIWELNDQILTHDAPLFRPNNIGELNSNAVAAAARVVERQNEQAIRDKVATEDKLTTTTSLPELKYNDEVAARRIAENTAEHGIRSKVAEQVHFPAPGPISDSPPPQYTFVPSQQAGGPETFIAGSLVAPAVQSSKADFVVPPSYTTHPGTTNAPRETEAAKAKLVETPAPRVSSIDRPVKKVATVERRTDSTVRPAEFRKQAEEREAGNQRAQGLGGSRARNGQSATNTAEAREDKRTPQQRSKDLRAAAREIHLRDIGLSHDKGLSH